MKKKLKLLWWVIGLGAVLGVYLVGVSSLRGQMEAQLSTACKRTVTVQAAQFVLPPAIRLIGLEVPAVRGEDRSPVKIDVIQARLLASAWGQGQLGGEVVVIHPQIHLEWTLEAKALSEAGGSPIIVSSGIPIAQASVRNGEITTIDRLAVPNVFWNLRDVSFTIRPGVRPQEREFALSGRLDDRNGRPLGTVEAGGTSFRGGPIDAGVKLSYGDLSELAPYLRRVLGTAPSRGAVQVETRLTLHQGVLMAHNDLTATDILFSDSQPTTLGPDGNRLVELLKDREGKIHLSFVVAGKPGEKMDWSDLAAGAMREAMRQAMGRSIQQVLSDTEQQKPVEELLRRKLDTLDR